MLILSRKLGESIVIDGKIVVKIMRLDGDLVKLGIEAPADVPVHRQEVYAEIQENNQKAMTTIKTKLPRLAGPVVSHRISASPEPCESDMIAPATPK